MYKKRIGEEKKKDKTTFYKYYNKFDQFTLTIRHSIKCNHIIVFSFHEQFIKFI